MNPTPCDGHYYHHVAGTNIWKCTECGHLVAVTPQPVDEPAHA